VKHTFIAEITIRQPFDDELEVMNAEATDEKRAEVTEELRRALAELLGGAVEDDGEVTVSVRIEEVLGA
jgi:hypothetical protein